MLAQHLSEHLSLPQLRIYECEHPIMQSDSTVCVLYMIHPVVFPLAMSDCEQIVVLLDAYYRETLLAANDMEQVQI